MASDRSLPGTAALAAARTLGLSEIPTLCIDWLSAEQQRAYAIADNRFAEKAGWDGRSWRSNLANWVTSKSN